MQTPSITVDAVAVAVIDTPFMIMTTNLLLDSLEMACFGILSTHLSR